MATAQPVGERRTITLTFDRYAHLFPSLDERLRDGLDKMIRTGRFI